MATTTCPMCGSDRVVFVLNAARHAFCAACGTKWTPVRKRRVGAHKAGVQPGRVNPHHPSIKAKEPGSE